SKLAHHGKGSKRHEGSGKHEPVPPQKDPDSSSHANNLGGGTGCGPPAAGRCGRCYGCGTETYPAELGRGCCRTFRGGGRRGTARGAARRRRIAGALSGGALLRLALRARISAVEPRALEHYSDGVEHLPQPSLALRAGG